MNDTDQSLNKVLNYIRNFITSAKEVLELAVKHNDPYTAARLETEISYNNNLIEIIEGNLVIPEWKSLNHIGYVKHSIKVIVGHWEGDEWIERMMTASSAYECLCDQMPGHPIWFTIPYVPAPPEK